MMPQSSYMSFFLLLLSTALTGVLADSAGCGKTPTLTSGTYNTTINGKNRQYILKLPDSYDNKRPHRLIFGLHWLSGSMTDVATGSAVERDVWAYYGLQRLANNSAIFVAPDGLNKGWANSGGEDVAFIDDIIKTVEADLCVNEKLRFSTGFSYGAGMSYSLACSRPTVFRAVAPLSGALLSGCSGGTSPVAFFGQHGVSDSILPIAEGRKLRDNFIKANGCTPQADKTPAKGSKTHTKIVYEGCSAGHPVVWIEFDGDHIPAPVDGSYDAKGTSYTVRETWDFFTQFT